VCVCGVCVEVRVCICVHVCVCVVCVWMCVVHLGVYGCVGGWGGGGWRVGDRRDEERVESVERGARRDVGDMNGNNNQLLLS